MYKRLHDTLPESRKLGQVSDFAFRVWTNALPKADWFGRLTADPEKLVLKCFQNRREKDRPTGQQIEAALDELADVSAGPARGLIHLYETPSGERLLVFHRHERHNPSGGWKTKPCHWDPPPMGLCRCVRYTKQEEEFSNKRKSGKPFGGREFRFFKGLFPTDECSSPLFSLNSSGEEGCGEKGGRDRTVILASPLERLCDEFTSLTGRVPMAHEPEMEELIERMIGFIERRGIDNCIAVMRQKVQEVQSRSGRPPSTLRYFVPVFEDDGNFNSDSPDVESEVEAWMRDQRAQLERGA